MDEVGPHSVTLLVLLQEYCRGLSETPEATAHESTSNEPWTVSLRHAISKILIRDIHTSPSALGSQASRTLSALLDELRKIPGEGQELALLIQEAIMDINSPEEILDHTDALRELISPANGGKGVLDPNGMLGLHIRRVLLVFDQMDFPQLSKLYRQIQRYKQTAAATVTVRGRGGLTAADLNERALPAAPMLSARESGRVFRRARELAAQGVSGDKLIEILGVPLESMASLPLVHYIRHLQCVQSKDASGALENLYRYFDLQAINATQPSREAGVGPAKSYFHYATLSVAALHHKFGNHKEALEFVLETVKIAQENLDHRCLQHALGWLSRLEEGIPSLKLARLFVDNTQNDESKEGRYLYSLAQLTFAKKLFSQGIPPSNVIEMVSGGYGISVLESHDELIGMSYMLHAGLFDMYGHAHLSMLYAQLHLRNRNPGAAEDGCEAYCKMATHYFHQGNTDLAYKFVRTAAKLYPDGTPTADIWMALLLQFDHQIALYKRNWAQAAEVQERLNLKFGKIESSKTDVAYRAALLNKERSRHEFAAEILVSLQNQLDGDPAGGHPALPLSLIKKTKLKQLAAEIFLETGNYMSALDAAEQAAKLAKSLSLLVMLAEIQVLLADIQLCCKNFDQALRQLNAATPRILAHGSLESKGKVYLVTGINHAISAFVKARDAFAKLGAKKLLGRAFYCLARAYDMIDDTEKRDSNARAFQELGL